MTKPPKIVPIIIELHSREQLIIIHRVAKHAANFLRPQKNEISYYWQFIHLFAAAADANYKITVLGLFTTHAPKFRHSLKE